MMELPKSSKCFVREGRADVVSDGNIEPLILPQAAYFLSIIIIIYAHKLDRATRRGSP
jgi:hypothetical protein